MEVRAFLSYRRAAKESFSDAQISVGLVADVALANKNIGQALDGVAGFRHVEGLDVGGEHLVRDARGLAVERGAVGLDNVVVEAEGRSGSGRGGGGRGGLGKRGGRYGSEQDKGTGEWNT